MCFLEDFRDDVRFVEDDDKGLVNNPMPALSQGVFFRELELLRAGLLTAEDENELCLCDALCLLLDDECLVGVEEATGSAGGGESAYSFNL